MEDRAASEPPAEVLRELSGSLCGRPVRLPVAVWVRSQVGPFFRRQAADGVGDHQTYVRNELARLVEIGMVNELSRNDRGRVFHQQVSDHPWWEIIDSAVRAAHHDRPPR